MWNNLHLNYNLFAQNLIIYASHFKYNVYSECLEHAVVVNQIKFTTSISVHFDF